MTTPSGLEAFTLYLDPDDPEDASIIRFLKPKVANKRASAEIRRAILVYLELLKNSNNKISTAISPQASIPPTPPMPFPPQQFLSSSYQEPNHFPASQNSEGSSSKLLQKARQSFMKR